jgi:putative hydrolase of the HAD superfamily
MARLEQVKAWVFDLDNTLYPATASLFPQIDRRMRDFIAARHKLEEGEAFRLQKSYYREFGTTLRGLMLMHKIEPDQFLDYVHDIDHSVLERSPRLDAALQGLPGRKLIFTNGSHRHAEKVLDRLGMARHFEGIFDIKAAGYVPKPDPLTYKRMAERHGCDPRTSAMFEDIARNLKPAAELGMVTVWVRAGVPELAHDTEDGHIDHVTEDLAAWLEAAVKP